MSVFFNGRQLISPTTASAVNDDALAPQSTAQSNAVALLGSSTSGQPKTPLVFGSPTDARKALGGGELLTAVLKAFSPSNQTGGPASVTAIRVDPATQSVLTLFDATAAAAINLVSSDYGQQTSQVKVSVTSGTTAGVKLTVQQGQNFFTQDNISRSLLQVQYTGISVSATMTVNGSQLVLSAPSGTPVATIDLNVYATIQQVVDRVNSVSGFAATVLGGNGALPSLNAFDYVTGVDVLSAPYTALAVLQASIDWLNTIASSFVKATRATGAGLPPAVLPFTYLGGGANGSITNNDWSAAYTVLQTVDVQWVSCVSADPAIHAMNDTHCQFMSTVGKSERRGVVGMALGSTDAAAIAEALSLNSDRTGLVHLGFYDYDLNGVLTLFPAYITAAMICGAFAGVSPGTPMTNKALTMRGIERVLQNPTQTDPLIQGGVLAIEKTVTGYKVVKSISTWLTNLNFNRVELSTGAAVDYVSRSVRAALDVLRGEKQGPVLLSRAASITDSALRALAVPDPLGPGVIVGDAASPAYTGISASITDDVLSVQFQASPVIPNNFVLITIYAVPFSGSVSV